MASLTSVFRRIFLAGIPFRYTHPSQTAAELVQQIQALNEVDGMGDWFSGPAPKRTTRVQPDQQGYAITMRYHRKIRSGLWYPSAQLQGQLTQDGVSGAVTSQGDVFISFWIWCVSALFLLFAGLAALYVLNAGLNTSAEVLVGVGGAAVFLISAVWTWWSALKDRHRLLRDLEQVMQS
jgi:hypothetical protein